MSRKININVQQCFLQLRYYNSAFQHLIGILSHFPHGLRLPDHSVSRAALAHLPSFDIARRKSPGYWCNCLPVCLYEVWTTSTPSQIMTSVIFWKKFNLHLKLASAGAEIDHICCTVTVVMVRYLSLPYRINDALVFISVLFPDSTNAMN